MPTLVMICDWLPPDFGAVGQYALQDARRHARTGENVVLFGLSSSASSVYTEQFEPGSLRVVRLLAASYDRSSLRQRAWWTFRTNVSLVWHALRDIRSSNVVMFAGSPPFLLHVIAPLNVVLRKRLVYRITDFFPECLMAEYSRPSRLLQMLQRLTIFWRRRIPTIEVLGEDQRRRLADLGIPAASIVLRRDTSPVPITLSTPSLPRPTELGDRRILLYSGNFGVAHDHETFLAAYRRHHWEGNGRVGLWLNAVGTRADLLEQALVKDRLPVHRTRPVPLDQLASLLVTPDAHLITLREPFVGYVLPSKVYGCIESRKKILYVGPRASDVHLLCEAGMARDMYRHADVGDSEAVFRALEQMGAS